MLFLHQLTQTHCTGWTCPVCIGEFLILGICVAGLGVGAWRWLPRKRGE